MKKTIAAIALATASITATADWTIDSETEFGLSYQGIMAVASHPNGPEFGIDWIEHRGMDPYNQMRIFDNGKPINNIAAWKIKVDGKQVAASPKRNGEYYLEDAPVLSDAVIDALKKGSEMTLTVKTNGKVNTYTYSLKGSADALRTAYATRPKF